MKKEVVFDERALEEINELKPEIREEFYYLINVLKKEGRLAEPEAKKLDRNLYEIRVRIKTTWRGFYAYINTNQIIILRIFQKQSQSTPFREIQTANKRLKQYL